MRVVVGGLILVTWPDYPADDVANGGSLTAAGLALRIAPKLGDRTSHELCGLARDAVGAIVSTDPFDAAVFEACPSLRVIARVGVGVDSIDLMAASAAGVLVTVTAGANESTVADHTVALMLAAVRRVAEHDAAVRRGEWKRTGDRLPWDLAGATIGLIGYGSIGRLVARRLGGFDVRILVSDPDPGRREDVLSRVSLDELLAASDVVSVHAPLLPSTRQLIGRREFSLMRPDTVFVNTSRGGLVDQDALLDALESGRLRAAALDVFEREPPTSQRLLGLHNVVLSPHLGGISEQSVREMTRIATASVLAVLRGEIPRGVVNPDALERRPLPPRAIADAQTQPCESTGQ